MSFFSFCHPLVRLYFYGLSHGEQVDTIQQTARRWNISWIAVTSMQFDRKAETNRGEHEACPA